MKKIYFITTNDSKFLYFKKFVQKYPQIKIEQLRVETPEIQAETNKQVTEFSAQWASKKYNLPVIVEDVGFYLEAFPKFPGPFLKYVELAIKDQGFFDLLQNQKNRKAHYELCVSYCQPNQKPITFSTYNYGSVGYKAKGKGGFIIDKIFTPDNENQTIGQLIEANEFKRSESHYQKLINEILKIN